MPTYQIRDPQSGRTLTIRGERPPTQTEAAKLFQSAEPSRLGQFAGGVKQGLGDVVSMVRHPVETAKAFGGGVVEAAKAVPDVARNLMDGDTRRATARGFVEGATEGATGVSADEARRDPWTAAGRFTGGVVIPAVALKGAPKVVRGLRTPRGPNLVAESNAGGVLTQARASKPIGVKAQSQVAEPPTLERVPYRAEPEAPRAPRQNIPEGQQPRVTGKVPTIEQVIAEALEDTRKPEAPRQVSLPPEPRGPAGLRTSAPAPKAAKKPKVETKAAEPVAEPTPETATAKARAELREGFNSDMPTIAEARRALGSDEAAALLGVAKQDVKKLAPGPSRRPLVADLADLDLGYQRQLANQRGAVSPGFLRTMAAATAGGIGGSLLADENPLAGGVVGALGGAALANPATAARTVQQARMMGMLSGAALPKSMAGNAGAFLTAAAERGSTAPIKEMLRVPTNLREAARGFTSGANPSHTQGIGALNVPGRLMGALDEASQKGLERAGLSTEEAQRLLLTKPKPLGQGTLAKAVESPVGQFVMPFQRIPFNSFAEGVNSLSELTPKSGAPLRRKALTAGAIGGGAVAGDVTDDPIRLAILAALFGPRAIPFALGAGATAGPQVLERVGVTLPEGSVKDLLDPLRPIDRPAILRLLEGQ